MNKEKIYKYIKYIIILLLIFLIIILGINYYVKMSVENKIIKNNDLSNIKDVDAILVLGAGIWNNKPSPMLKDRLLEAINLYENGVSPKIIMSGDHAKKDYDEVNVMKNFGIENGISSENIFMDHAGLSTYDSIYRAKEIFKCKKIIIVTQEYHLYRALYIAKKLNIEAYGVPSNPREYSGQLKRELREILARNKDFVKTIIKPKPTYLGKSIPVSGNGDITNDK